MERFSDAVAALEKYHQQRPDAEDEQISRYLAEWREKLKSGATSSPSIDR
jgi:seryl-tRNA(Sec) selenium transferase